MRIVVCAILLSMVTIARPACGFNDKGHMVVAQLAWLDLDLPTRAAAIRVLEGHPHYDEFLAAEKPSNVDEDEWVFMRAATWPDWVKSNYSDEFDRRNWHFINIPFVPSDSEVTPPDHVPPPVHVVRQISWCSRQVLNSPSPKWKAVNLCWVLHLIGDIHQPLHCATLFSEQFPDGDVGGNGALLMVGQGQKNLHSFWDGLLGRSTEVNDLRSTATDIAAMEKSQPDLTAADLANNTNASAWAQEGYRAAVKHAYLDGKLEVARKGDHHIPQAPSGYAANAGKVIRISVAKGGHRLAKTVRQLVQ